MSDQTSSQGIFKKTHIFATDSPKAIFLRGATLIAWKGGERACSRAIESKPEGCGCLCVILQFAENIGWSGNTKHVLSHAVF